MQRILQHVKPISTYGLRPLRSISYIVDAKGLSPSLFFDNEKGSIFDPKTTIHDVYVMEMQRQSRGLLLKKEISKVNFNQMNERK
jgi:hypothetical protein